MCSVSGVIADLTYCHDCGPTELDTATASSSAKGQRLDTLKSKPIRANPTSFPSVCLAANANVVEPMKRSISWSGTPSVKGPMVSPGGVAELFIEVSTYDDNILNSKFDQQVYTVDCHVLYYTVNTDLLTCYRLSCSLIPPCFARSQWVSRRWCTAKHAI
jgi:hypothetical protein